MLERMLREGRGWRGCAVPMLLLLLLLPMLQLLLLLNCYLRQ